jgi:hypothetical protein
MTMKDPTVQLVSDRLVAFPAFAKAFELDASEKVTSLPEQSRAASESLDASINYRVSVNGGRAFTAPALGAVDDVAEFRDWSADTLLEIKSEAIDPGRKHKAVFDHRYGGELTAWRSLLKADFVLISLFLDGQQSAGRSALNGISMVVGAGATFARRDGIACVVALSDGRVVWCQVVDLGSLNVRERNGAQAAVDKVLAPLWLTARRADPAALVSAPTAGDP